MSITVQEAKDRIHAHLRSKRQSLAFAAPEVQDDHWADLRDRLESVVEEMGDSATEESAQGIVVYVCPNHPGHYYAAPTFTPDNPEITKPQLQRSGNDGKVNEIGPRVNCPYCQDHPARVPYRVATMVRVLS